MAENDPTPPLCACGCGERVKKNPNDSRHWNTFIRGHTQRKSFHHAWRNGTARTSGYVLVQAAEHHRANKNGYARRADLVAEQMLGRPLAEDEMTHHKNRDRSDDHPDNLAVMTRSAHRSLHISEDGHPGAKVTEAQVRTIRALRGRLTIKRIGALFDIHFSTVSLIQRRKLWKHVV